MIDEIAYANHCIDRAKAKELHDCVRDLYGETDETFLKAFIKARMQHVISGEEASLLRRFYCC